MNNVTFGDGSSGYYETVAGGAGAVSGAFIFLEIKFMVFKFVSFSCKYCKILSFQFSRDRRGTVVVEFIRI